MAENLLTPGVSRLGWFADGDENTPHTATVLEDDGERISLRVPWLDSSPRSPYERWFQGDDSHWGDDPDRTLYRYEVPETLWFRDVDGLVTLVGCRDAGFTSNARLGQGRVDVRFAVLGTGEVDYREINGLRSDLPGLSDWMSLRSLSQEFERDDGGSLRSVTLRLKAADRVPLSRTLNLCIRPSFRTSKQPVEAGTTLIRESLQIETLVKDARSWHHHLAAHNTVRDLVDIAAWRPFGYANQWAHRRDDPHLTLSGRTLGSRWPQVRSYVTRSDTPSSTRPRFLYVFDDVGARGFRRWAALRHHFARGIDPILSTLEQQDTTLEGQLAQSGIGLDGIGYQIARDVGVGKDRASRESHRGRLLRLANDLPIQAPFDVEEWASRASAAYNGVKHANRDMPDLLTMANTLRENRLIMRLWVAGRIGVPPKTLEHNLQIDPMMNPYVAW